MSFILLTRFTNMSRVLGHNFIEQYLDMKFLLNIYNQNFIRGSLTSSLSKNNTI